jgi:hypothetical protein
VSLESTIIAGRAAFAGICTDTCRITRAGSGERVFNEGTGQYTDPARVTVYEGPCRVQVKADINSNVVETTAGEREWTYLTGQLQLPVGDDPRIVTGETKNIRPDMIAECLTAPFDDDLPGRLFNIQGTYHKSQAVYRRFRVREVVA